MEGRGRGEREVKRESYVFLQFCQLESSGTAIFGKGRSYEVGDGTVG